MKKLNSLFILGLLVFAFSFKTKPFEGTIKYAIDYHTDYGIIKYPQELSAIIKGDMIRIDITLPFAEISQIIDCKKRTSIKLCTVDGLKYCVKTDLKKTAPEKVFMAKDSTQTIKDLPCSFGRIYNANSHYVVYATSKYFITKSITDCGAELPYRLFYPQKEFTSKLIMKQDGYDDDGETTYLVESISESSVKDTDILPSITAYNEVTEEALGKIINDYFKKAH